MNTWRIGFYSLLSSLLVIFVYAVIAWQAAQHG